MAYNPEEQKCNTNELFNNADGNDDILSDIDDGDNIRHGMWAITPYSVEDGTGVVNEVYDRKLADEIAPLIAEKFNLTLQYIDSGENGVAYDAGNGKVLKITGDKSEAVENLKLIGKKLNYIAQPYVVLKITSKNKQMPETYAIILEKLQTNVNEFERLIDRMNFAFKKILGIDYYDVILHYTDQPDFSVDDDKVNAYLKKNPQDAEFFYGIVRIAEELKKYDIESVDYINPKNLGYKPSGALAFFDVGFGSDVHTQGSVPKEMEIDEDGSSKFSQTDSIGRDDFPAYDQNDTSPSIKNDLNANSAMYNEDLEYNHASDATQDEYIIDERVLSSMKGSSTVNVKKKCRLGGLGNTSAPCNQGDIGNLEIKSLNEEENKLNFPAKYMSGMEDVNDLERLLFNSANGNKAYMIEWAKSVDLSEPIDVSVYQSGEVVFNDGHHRVLAARLQNKNVNVNVVNNRLKPEIWKEYLNRISMGYSPIDINPDRVNLNYTDNYAIPSPELMKRGKEEITMKSGRREDLFKFYLDNAESNNINEEIDAKELEIIRKYLINYFDLNNVIEPASLPIKAGNVRLYHQTDKENFDNIKKERKININNSTGKLNKEPTAIWGKVITNSDENGFYGSPKERYTIEYQIPKNEVVSGMVNRDVTSDEILAFHNPQLFNIEYLVMDDDYLRQFIENPEKFLKYKETSNDSNEYGYYLIAKAIIEYNKNVVSLNEEIDANELYGENSNEKSIQAMIDGKKSIAFVNLTPELSNIVKNNGYRTIKVDQKPNQELNMHIVYYNDALNRERAMRLYDIARSREGYLKAYSPNEEREIGNLLGYTENSIENHIKNKFDKKIPEVPVMPEKSPEDFDLDENIETENEIEFTNDALLNTFLNKLNQKEPLQRNPFIRRELMYGEKGSLEFSRFDKENTNEIELSDIVAYEKSQGVGSSMMKDIIDVADEMNVKLTLTAKPFGNDPNGLKLFPLINFYKKFGFQADLSIFDGEFETEEEYLNYVREYPDEGFDMYREPNGMNEMINEAEIMSLQDLPFKNDVEQMGGKILSVGGAVRDEFLGKESKDLDILVTGIPMEQLEQILSKYGKVDAVGKSFGILKFKPKGATEDIDVAIPRSEKSTGEGGHKGFEVSSDHELPVEQDLFRRDFTINAIAKDMDGNIIDPFGGQEDLKNKIIRIVNPEAFSDDPLRMLRAVQFASRFGFTIEPKTMEMIKANASRIVEIPPERILTEFDKIVKKGNVKYGAVLLDETGLFSQIFGRPPYYSFEDTIYPFDKVKTMGEFVFLLMHNTIESPAEFYKSNLKGDIDTYKEIKGLNAAFEMDSTNPIAARSVAHNMYLYSPQSLQSQIIPNTVQRAAQELLQGKYPKNSIELAVNGNDLINAGLKGKEIGDMQKSLLLKVYGDKVKNDKEELLGLVGGNEDSEPIDEAKNKWVNYKYDGEPFYFDPETLSDAKWQVLTNLLTKMGWQARPYIEWKKYFLEKGAGTIPNDILRNTDSSDSTKIAAIKKVITPNKKPSESQNIITKAKRYFGMTNMFSEAGYLLQDGTMLNFSGQKFGGSPNRRDMDHREVNIIDTDMVEFMALGNIRMQSYGFELTQEPTREQINTLRRFIGSKNGEVTVDFSKKGQYSVEHSVEYQSGTNVSRILNDIVNYYRTGIKPISKPNLTEEINNVLYSAVVLDEQSRAKLLKVFRLMIPEGWEVLADHMTINLGAIKPQFKDDLGDVVDLSVLDYAIDDKVMAVGVEGYPTTNAKAHITIAVNRSAGGKPVMSNNLTDWKEINFKIELKGIITEIKK